MENNNNLFDLQIDPVVSSHLSDSAKWSKFLAIVGFIFCGLMILAGVFASSLISSAMMGGGAQTIGAGALAVIYVGIALVYFFPCLYLYRFATNMQLAIRNTDQQRLTESFRNMKSCYKFMGILTIILLSFYVLAFFGGILVAMSMR